MPSLEWIWKYISSFCGYQIYLLLILFLSYETSSIQDACQKVSNRNSSLTWLFCKKGCPLWSLTETTCCNYVDNTSTSTDVSDVSGVPERNSGEELFGNISTDTSCLSGVIRAYLSIFRCMNFRRALIIFDRVHDDWAAEVGEAVNNLNAKTALLRVSREMIPSHMVIKLRHYKAINPDATNLAILTMASQNINHVLVEALNPFFKKWKTSLIIPRLLWLIDKGNGSENGEFPSKSSNFMHIPPMFLQVKRHLIQECQNRCQSTPCYRETCEIGLTKFQESNHTAIHKCDAMNVRFPQEKAVLKGKHLLASTNEWPPFVIRHRDNGFQSYRGFCIDIWNELSKRLKFSYTFVEPDDGEWGRLINGTWTGLVGQLQLKEVDVAVAPLSAQPARSGVMDFSYSYFQQNGKLLVRRQRADSYKSVLDVFSSIVLILVALCSLVSAVILVCFEKLLMTSTRYISNRRGVTKLTDAITLTYGAVVSQASRSKPESVAGRTVVSLWWLFAIVLVNMYSAFMIADLAVPSTKQPVDSLSELVKRKDYKWGMLGSTIFPSILKKSNNTAYKALWGGISRFKETDEDILSNDFGVHLKRMREEKYAYLGPVPALNFYNATHCELFGGRDSFFTAHYVLGFQKHSPYTEIISKELLGFEERGLLLPIIRRWFHVAGSCDQQIVHRRTVITLNHIKAAFYALISGILTATFTCVIEIIFDTSKRKLRTIYENSKTRTDKEDETGMS